MARRESWRGESSKRVGEENGPTVEAAGPRKEQVGGRENDRLLRDGQRSLYSDIGSGMAKW